MDFASCKNILCPNKDCLAQGKVPKKAGYISQYVTDRYTPYGSGQYWGCTGGMEECRDSDALKMSWFGMWY